MTDPRRLQVERMLHRMGDTHTVEDIVAEIQRGDKQGFTYGESWAVTQILVFPRKSILEICLFAGKLSDIDGMLAAILEFAQRMGGIDEISTHARLGWSPAFAKKFGFKQSAVQYKRKL